MGLITMTETFKDFWTLLSMKELLKIFNLYLNHTPLDLTSSLWGKSGGKVKSHCKETIREIQNKGYSTKL